MSLFGALAELGGAPLVGNLNRAERGTVAIHEHGLEVPSIDGGVGLQEDPEKQVSGEVLVGAGDVNPCVRVAGIGIELQPLELVLGYETPSRTA